jgi:hypothetical protein
VFDQYLRNTEVPAFEYSVTDSIVRYRWNDVVDGFAMPVKLTLPNGGSKWLRPTREWQWMTWPPLGAPTAAPVAVDPNFYVRSLRLLSTQPPRDR